MIERIEQMVETFPNKSLQDYIIIIQRNIKNITPEIYIELGRVIGKKESAPNRLPINQNNFHTWQRPN